MLRNLWKHLRNVPTQKRFGNVCNQKFSSLSRDDNLPELEADAERKIGLLLKMIFAGTATYVAYKFVPYMGDNLVEQSISLLHVKDPLFKRMGASRIARFATDDERRVKIVELGGDQDLLNMLESAKDDRTRKEALKALQALSQSDVVVDALHHAGGLKVIHSAPISTDEPDIVKYRSNILKRFHDLKYDMSILEDEKTP